MMIRILTLLFALLPGLAAAADETFPALYDVTGVTAPDTLNVRAAPGSGAEKTGALAHDAKAVEVTAVSDGWGRINLGEASGWVYMRYLARRPGQDGLFLRPARCFGTEPFWSLEFPPGQVVFRTPDLPPVTLIPFEPQQTNRYSGSYAFTAMTNVGPSFGVLRRAECNDGMSDRDYGLAADFIHPGPTGVMHYTGCCVLSGN